MNEEHKHDWLEDALRQGPRYIDDAGFTGHVVAALPPARRHRIWLRPVILGGASLVAGVIGLLVLPGGKFVSDCVLQLVWARSFQPSLVLPALVVA